MIVVDRLTLKRAAVASSVLGGVAAVLVFGSFTVCPVALLTRHPCPGCGLTRAVLAAAHGGFNESFHHHPMAMVMFPLVAYVFARNFVGYVRTGAWGQGEKAKSKSLDMILIALGIAMIAIWIARFFGAFGGPEPIG
jgi:hypothetical protein